MNNKRRRKLEEFKNQLEEIMDKLEELLPKADVDTRQLPQI